MIYQHLINHMKIQSNLADNKFSSAIGALVGYDPVNYLGMVQLFEADEEENAAITGWLPIGATWIGNGWGLFAPPNIGDLVEVNYQEGSLQNAYIGLRYYNNVNASPMQVPSGEWWLIHQTGSLLKFTNDGKITINGNVEIDITAPELSIACSTSVQVTAPHVNIISPDTTIGASGGILKPVMLSDSTPANNLKAS